MKNHRKVLYLIFSLLSLTVKAQFDISDNAAELRLGKSLFPGDNVSLAFYRNFENGSTQGLSAFAEFSRKNNLTYSSYGFSYLAGYYIPDTKESIIRIKGEVGLLISLENEPHIHRSNSWTKRLGAAALLQGTCEILLSDMISLPVSAQQQVYIYNQSGVKHFLATVGVRLKLPSL